MSAYFIGMTALFGVCGVLARLGIDRGFAMVGATGFPWATLAINLVGSFAAGAFGGTSALSAEWRQAIMIGLLGGFTTFSAFSLQSFRMIQAGQSAEAIAYLVLSPVLGVALAAAGWKLTS